MPDIVEALHNLARQRGRPDGSPLISLRQLPPREGTRISHLPISQRLSQAWITLTGQPFRQHQSLSLSALRRGDPFALAGSGPAARQTLHLLTSELLRAEPQTTALLLAPDELAILTHQAEFEQLNQAIGGPLSVAAALDSGLRAAFAARVVLATPHILHERLLRHHDRAWQLFWSQLRIVLIADIHRYTGVAAAHLGMLLLRAERLAPTNAPPLLAATIAETRGAGDALAQISGQTWRLITIDDVPRPAVNLALWHSPADRAREIVALGLGLQRAGAAVHISCADYEAPFLRALFGSDATALSVGPGVLPARAQILAGASCGPATLRQAIDSGAELVVLLLGDDPVEHSLVRLAGRDPQALPILDVTPPAWIAAPTNAYVAAAHLVCAAAEHPLSAAEVEAWQVQSIVSRLEEHHQLMRLPEATEAWQPLAGGDPYAGFDLYAVGAAGVALRDDQGHDLGSFDPTAFDRWGFLGAMLPPLSGGYKVVNRDDTTQVLTLRPVADGRRSFPLRRCNVRVRDRRERRVLRGHEIGWGRVVIDEEVFGYREYTPGNAATERALQTALTASWNAPAIWIDLPLAPTNTGQVIGWSLALALPLRCLTSLYDVVPAYDAEARRIYFIDAAPGGNGVAAWLYANIEELLPLAYDVALDCRADPLLEPLARADMDWLLSILGGSTSLAAGRSTAERSAPVEARRTEQVGKSAERQPVAPPQVSAPLVEREPPRSSAPPARREPEPPRSSAPPARREPEPPRTDPVQPALPLESSSADTESTPKEARSAGGERNATKPRYKPNTPRERPRHSESRGSSSPRGSSAEPIAPAKRKQAATRSDSAAARSTAQKKREEPPATPPRPAEQERPAPAPRAESPAEPLPDAAAMVARLRRLREKREEREPAAAPRASQSRTSVTARFSAGDRIFCMPWGYGKVRASQIDSERELLLVEFPDHGELTVDPAVSAVRLVNEEKDEE